MTRRWRNAAAVTAALALSANVAACGSDDSPLAQTERNMASLKAATIDLRLAASAGTQDTQTGPVGFRLEGPYSFSEQNDLAVFDLTYERLLGSTKRVSRVRSTGKSAFVTVDSRSYRVPKDDLGPLRVSDDAPGGIGDLGISGWVRDPKVVPGDRVGGEATDVITGRVDVGDMLSDLARVAGSLGDDTQLAALDGEAAERLQKLAKRSSIRVVTTAKQRELRSLRAVVDFGSRAPRDLRKILGAYADARIEVALSLDDAPRRLRVEPPADFETP